MRTSKGCVGLCAVLLLVLGIAAPSWSMSPRYMLYGRASLVAVEAAESSKAQDARSRESCYRTSVGRGLAPQQGQNQGSQPKGVVLYQK